MEVGCIRPQVQTVYSQFPIPMPTLATCITKPIEGSNTIVLTLIELELLTQTNDNEQCQRAPKTAQKMTMSKKELKFTCNATACEKLRLVPAILVIHTSSVGHKAKPCHQVHQVFNHSLCSVRHAADKKTSEYHNASLVSTLLKIVQRIKPTNKKCI